MNRISTSIVLLVAVACCQADDAVGRGWKSHAVRQLNGGDAQIRLPARLQIVTERMNRIVSVPYIIYMPDKDRLLMLVSCDAPSNAESTMPYRAFLMSSDDHGASWTDPAPVRDAADASFTATLGTALVYLGQGNVLFYTDSHRWFSGDYGGTWGETLTKAPIADGKPWHIWDPPLIDRDGTGSIVRLAETGYHVWRPSEDASIRQQAYIRFSTDAGRTWGRPRRVSQWEAVSEVALFRTGNGDLLAACRTDVPSRMGKKIDHFEGLGISFFQDDGRSWSPVEKLYDYGRHHPSLLLMPNQNIVMTYVVREGYIDTEDGYPRFGIEAVVSRDHGRSWDLDHRYVLHTWVGNRKRGVRYDWWPSSQCTSSLLLPDGTILTAFGTGYRSRPGRKVMKHFSPRDVGLVRWRLNANPVNSERTIRDAAFDSDLRNRFDPSG